MSDAPKWLTSSRVERVVAGVQRILEWDIRRVNVYWYADAASFQKAHGYDSTVLAVTKTGDNSVHLGPRVDNSNFDSVFAHELGHVILFQKYKGAVPRWLEEGVANYVARRGKVDYNWLASQPLRPVRDLVHPFQGALADPKYHYAASTAALELIASKCNLGDLLQLSVGSRLESYLSTFCEIDDMDSEFKRWISKKKKH